MALTRATPLAGTETAAENAPAAFTTVSTYALLVHSGPLVVGLPVPVATAKGPHGDPFVTSPDRGASMVP
jgi:hypothetical protein